VSTATIAKSARTRGQVEPLSDAVSHILEECRMVLPGIQALFGFQLIAVFNQTFWDKLQPHEQVIHFAAIYLVPCPLPWSWRRRPIIASPSRRRSPDGL